MALPGGRRRCYLGVIPSCCCHIFAEHFYLLLDPLTRHTSPAERDTSPHFWLDTDPLTTDRTGGGHKAHSQGGAPHHLSVSIWYQHHHIPSCVTIFGLIKYFRDFSKLNYCAFSLLARSKKLHHAIY